MSLALFRNCRNAARTGLVHGRFAALLALSTVLAACGSGGGSNSTPPPPPPLPTVTLTANPTTVASGSASTLTWSSTDATGCAASGGWSGTEPTSGSTSTGNLTATTTFTLACTGAGGSASQSATVTVSAPPPPPSVTLTANPTSVVSGGTSMLTWSSTNATACTASGGWTGTQATSNATGVTVGPLTATTTYTLTCTGAGGSTSQSATVTVGSAPPPTVSLTANPTAIASGGTSVLTWSSTNATSCTATGGWSGTQATSGTFTTPALSATTTFSLTCTGPGGTTAPQSAIVSVVPAPTVTLTANPTSVASGGTSTLTWSSTNATTCTASGGWSGTKPTSGSSTTAALTAQTSFTLTCTGTGGSGQATATVMIGAAAPTVALTATPSTIVSGSTSSLTWTSTNATSCTASGGWTGAQAINNSTGVSVSPTTTTAYTLTCTGAGGSASSTATVTVTGSTSIFPLHLVTGGRYLQDAQGNPFLLQGDAAWSLIAQLSDADVDTYIADRKAKGFNALLVNLIEHLFADKAPADIAGDQPFTTTGDFSTPNDTYFNHAVSVVTKAQAAGMVVLLVPAYMGYGCPTSLGSTNQGWYAEMNGSGGGTTKLQGYGAYIASKIKAASLNNIIWVNGGDCDPTNKALLNAIATGINGVTPNALFTFHGERNNNIASGELTGSGDSWLNINTIYTDDQFVVDCAHAAFTVSPIMPFFLVEAIYENEAGGFAAAGVRQQAWQAVLGGAMGQVMGNNPIWCYGEQKSGMCLKSTWKPDLADAAAGTMPYIATILGSNWTQLAPDSAGTYLSGVGSFGACSISGTGGKGSKPVAAFTATGSRGVVYTPTNNASFTIQLSAMAGAGAHVAASWYDPTNGASQTASGSPYAASGTHTFTTPGNNHLGDGDWVLVLTAQP